MKKGFTLIELLAVITVLALVMLIVIPLIGGAIDNTKKSATKDSIELYGRAIETAIADYYAKYPIENTVTLKQLEEGKFLKYKGKKVECTMTQIVNRKVYLKGCTVGGKETDYEYGKYDPTPELAEGLIPVEYHNDKWVVADQYSDSWYNYDNQKWANAVVLKQGIRKEVGDEVKVDGSEALMMYVWIPRFEYKIKGTYGKGGTDANHPGEIEVNFIPKEVTTPSSSEYHVHPAFEFGSNASDMEHLSGIWVGKFEISHSKNSELYLKCTTTECDEAANLRILPNVSSLVWNKVSNFWYGIKSIESKTETFGLSNIDVHMMKNSEWGAVAYLSQSKYGKYGNPDYEGVQKEVYINNSNSYYTGRSGGNPSGSTPLNETYLTETSTIGSNQYGYYTYDGYLIDLNTGNKTLTRDMSKGPGASTTGNIYGIYDMSGGAEEYVMGVFGDSEGIYSGLNNETGTYYNSGFSGKLGHGGTIEGATVPDPKYYDIYKTSTVNTACGNNEVCYGHALSETSGWYGDEVEMISANIPWFNRGGDGETASDSICGLFNFEAYLGNRDDYHSTRAVCFAK